MRENVANRYALDPGIAGSAGRENQFGEARIETDASLLLKLHNDIGEKRFGKRRRLKERSL